MENDSRETGKTGSVPQSLFEKFLIHEIISENSSRSWPTVTGYHKNSQLMLSMKRAVNTALLLFPDQLLEVCEVVLLELKNEKVVRPPLVNQMDTFIKFIADLRPFFRCAHFLQRFQCNTQQMKTLFEQRKFPALSSNTMQTVITKLEELKLPMSTVNHHDFKLIILRLVPDAGLIFKYFSVYVMLNSFCLHTILKRVDCFDVWENSPLENY